MKRIILFAVWIIVSNVIYSQQYWIHKPSPTTKWLTRIQFVDTVYGWAAGDSGTVIHTSNSGQNWTVQNTGLVTFPIDDIFFLNRRLGWAVVNDYFSFGTRTLRTTNGGANWQVSVFPDTTVFLAAVYFLDSLNGFMGAFTGQIYKSSNGGISWDSCHVDTNYCPYLYLFPKVNFHFLNAQTGFACGGQIDLQGMIWKTTNAGIDWFTYCITPEPLERIKAVSSGRILAVGGDYEYGSISAHSYNNGQSWLYDLIGPNDSTSFFGIGQAIAFRTPSEVWVPLAYSQKWALSIDSGTINSSWQEINAPDSTAVYDATFVTPTFGWACGTSGALMKYNTDIIGITKNENHVPLRSALFQNYPNPFNPATTIRYYLEKSSFVRITIFDLIGKEVINYNEGMRPAGSHKFKFFALNLASGIYIYKIEAADRSTGNVFTQSKKMVILK